MAYKSPIDFSTLGGLSGNPLEAMRMAQQQRSDLRTSEMAQSMGYEPQIGDPGYGKGSMAPSAQINQPAQATGAPTTGGVMTGDMNSSSVANPFEGKTFQITPSNEMGGAAPMFKPGVSNAAAKMYGTPLERQMSMPKSPLGFKDQTGDGKITQADVIKARTEGYSESPASMVEFERDYVNDGSYANPETALDTGTGQVIADTISSIGASAAGAVGEGDGSTGLDRIKARGERQAARQANKENRQANRDKNKARRQRKRSDRKSKRNA